MARGGTLLRLAGLLGLLFMASEPLSAQIGLEEVTALRFQGNRTFSNEALAGSILTRETECRSFILLPFCVVGADFSQDPYYLTEREFRMDHARVHAFYVIRGFRDVQVDTVVTRPRDGEVELTFRIEEGRPVLIRDVEFRLADELPDSSVLEDLPVRVGDPLSILALSDARDTLETRLRNEGFAHAEVLRNYDLIAKVVDEPA